MRSPDSVKLSREEIELPISTDVIFSTNYDYPGQVLRPTAAGLKNSGYARPRSVINIPCREDSPYVEFTNTSGQSDETKATINRKQKRSRSAIKDSNLYLKTVDRIKSESRNDFLETRDKQQ